MVTKYIRPGPNDAGSQYGTSRPCWGTGDGNSYANAYSGFDDPDWLAALSTTDEVYVCGAHIPQRGKKDRPFSTTGIRWREGTAELPTLIRGDYAADPGIIVGGSIYNNITWTGPTSNVWSAVLSTTGEMVYQWYLFEDTVGDGAYADLARLEQVADLATCQTTDGSYYWDSAAFTIHVNPFTASDPTLRILFSAYGYWFGGSTDANYPTPYCVYYKLEMHGIRWLTWKGDNNNLSFIKCKIGYCGYRPFAGDPSIRSIYVHRCEMYSTPNGFYSDNPDEPKTGGIYFTHNFMYDIGNDESEPDADSHAFGVQDLSTAIIKRNRIYRAGKPIGLWLSAQGAMRNITIANNSIRESHNSNGEIGYSGDGASIIMSGPSTYDSAMIDNVLIDRNFVVGPDTINLHQNLIRNKWGGEAVQVTNNFFDGNNTVERIYFDSSATSPFGNHYLRDTTLSRPLQYYIYLTSSSATYDGNYNQLEHNAGANDFYRGGNYADLGAWQAVGSLYDPNSRTGPPNAVLIRSGVTDPEVMQIDDNDNFYVYQTGTIAFMLPFDVYTGEGVGIPLVIDTGLVPITISLKGPAPARDNSGLIKFVYCKYGAEDKPQIWEAIYIGNGDFATQQISPDDGNARINILASTNPDDDYYRLMYVSQAYITLCSRQDTSAETQASFVGGGISFPFRFDLATGTTKYAVTQGGGAGFGEVMVGDLVAEPTIETNVAVDDDTTWDPFVCIYEDFADKYGIVAQFGSEAVGYDQIKFWLSSDGGLMYALIDTFEIPAEALADGMIGFKSTEVVSIGGSTFMIMTVLNELGSVYTDVTHSQIWMLEMKTGTWTRVDDDSGTLVRHEGEGIKLLSVDGVERLAVIFNVILDTTVEMWLHETDKTNPPAGVYPVNTTGSFLVLSTDKYLVLG